jgi:hypothetical protein
MVTEKVSECINSVSVFSCEDCNYITNVKSNYKKHCMTARHKNVTNVTVGDGKVSESINIYSCTICNKEFKSRNGLWCHSKKCSPEENKISPEENKISSIENPPIDASLIIKLIQQNENLQNLLVQQARDYQEETKKHQEETKNILTTYSNEKSELINKLAEREPANNNINTINGNVTNNNQKFNLNFFLNETCKDAMTIQEFLENLVINFDDLLNIGNDGFVTGVSDILIKQLRDMEVSKRPIHCTDSKRDTIYLKENAAWNKDDKDKTKLKQIIEKIEYKNVVALRDWCNENPDARVNNTPNNILKDKIYLQTLQGDDKTRDKIIKNVSKEIMVDKE